MTVRLSVAVLGLDNSHPFVDAANLQALEASLDLLVVGGEQPERLARFSGEFPTAVFVPDVHAMLATAPDGILVTLRPSRLLEVLPALAASGLPVFINKQGIATRRQLELALPPLAQHPHRLMTSSVLRFAPDAQDTVIEVESLRSVHVTVAHGVGHWSQPGNGWQGEIAEGGAIVGSLGYHGFELLDQVVGPGFTVDEVVVQNRKSQLAGGDHAIISGRWSSGVTAVIELDAAVDGEHYELRWDADGQEGRVVLDSARDDAFGYRAAMAAFVRHIAGEAELSWARSLGVLEASTTAHQLAYGNRPT